MGRFVMLSENHLNTRVFPGHVLAASGEAPGNDVELVNSGRRQRQQNMWTPPGGSENTEATITVTYDRVRMTDTIFIDRGHNLAGKTIRLRFSMNNFVTYEDELVATLPSQTFPYSRLSQANGVRTGEGAWGWRFGARAGLATRLVIDAMGTGLKPEIVGLYIGLAFRATNPLVKPFTHGLRELDYPMVKSPAAWVGAGEISQRRRTPIHIRLEDGEYAVGSYHVEDLYLRGRPSWIVPDDEQAERAFLSRAEPQTAGFQIPQGKSQWECDLDAPEHEPRVV